MKPLIIIGAGGHATSVANVALSLGRSIACFVGKKGTIENKKLDHWKVFEDLFQIENLDAYEIALAIGDNYRREQVYTSLISKHKTLSFPMLAHTSSVISCLSSIKKGTIVMPGAVVGPNSNIEEFCVINTRSSLDHDCQLKSFASLAPGVTIGGSVSIGNRSAISIGATVKHGVQIGSDCIVGAQSYLHKDLDSNHIAYGIPARKIRSREKGEAYL